MSNAIAPIEDLKKNINLLAPQFKMALPPHVPVEKFVRTIITAIQTTPALVKASRPSLYAAAMKCASAGLLPDGREAALVPYGTEAQFLPMIGGILKQLRNSGELAMITANVIFKNDHFRYWVDGDGEHIEHEPILFGDRGDELGVYALAKLKDGSIYVEVMTAGQIASVKNVSKAKNGPAWSGPFADQMAKKTVVRRLSKRLPISTDREALDSENDDFDFRNASPAPAPEREAEVVEDKPVKRKSRLSQAIEGQSEKIEQDTDPIAAAHEADPVHPTQVHDGRPSTAAKKEVKNFAPGAGTPPKYDERDEDPNFSMEV